MMRELKCCLETAEAGYYYVDVLCIERYHLDRPTFGSENSQRIYDAAVIDVVVFYMALDPNPFNGSFVQSLSLLFCTTLLSRCLK